MSTTATLPPPPANRIAALCDETNLPVGRPECIERLSAELLGRMRERDRLRRAHAEKADELRALDQMDRDYMSRRMTVLNHLRTIDRKLAAFDSLGADIDFWRRLRRPLGDVAAAREV